MSTEVVAEQNTLGHIERLVQQDHPTFTVTAVALRVGNHNGPQSLDREAHYRYFSIHAPATESREPNNFYPSLIWGAAISPISWERVGPELRKVALVKACILTSGDHQRMDDEIIRARFISAIEASEKLHSDPFLVEPQYELNRIIAYLRAARGVLDGAGPDVVAAILSDRPAIAGEGADDAHSVVYRTHVQKPGQLYPGSMGGLHFDSAKGLDIVEFTVADWQERDRTMKAIKKELGFDWFAKV